MIKNIFLPEKINSYYLFPQRIVGIAISPSHINATQIYLKGRSIIVEKCIQEALDTDISLPIADRIITTLKKIKTQLDPYHTLHTVLPGNVMVFKEIKLPFYDYEKIKMVINFEVEPLLPFAIKDAIVDFIITKHIKEEQSAEILVAATQKKYITEHLSLFEQADMKPDAVTVDLIALYGLYQLMPSYTQHKGSIALLGLGTQSTHIAHIYNNQLRTIRTLNKGIHSIVKIASESLHMPAPDIMNHFIRFGLKDTDQPLITEALKTATTLFLNDIYFTLNSFTAQTMQGEAVNSLLLFDDGALISELPSFIYQKLSIPATVFNIQELITAKKITLKAMSRIDSTHLASLSAVLPNNTTDNFNLLKNEFSPTSSRLLIKQLSAAILLSVISLALLIGYSVIETNKLETQELENKQEAIELLANEFPKEVDKQEESLETALEQANAALKKKEKTWRPFSSQSKVSFLTYWLELTNLIDKNALEFSVEFIKMTPESILIKAKVKDWEQLKILEKDLKQSKLFIYTESQTSPSFELKLTLPQTNEGA